MTAHSAVFRPFCVFAACAALLGCGEPGPSISEALAESEEEKLPEGYKPKPKPRPKGLGDPTKEEFDAWNRSDPEGEKHLHKWDKAHLDAMLGYWEELECFREEIKKEGEKARGAEPGSPTEEQWHQFKRVFIPHVNGWQQRLFAEQPRIQEKSKFVGNFLEAHELVMNGYPKAYNSNDAKELEKADLHWQVIEAKMSKYVKNLGEEFPELDPEDAKAMQKHAEVCEEALKPPKRGKERKRRGRKSPI